MTETQGTGAEWRELTVGFLLPDVAFGAAVDIDTLLSDPELHYTAAALSSRLLLMPRSGTFSRLLLEWDNLPELGVFTASSLTVAPLLPEQIGRLEIWMRDVAAVLHDNRDRIRETAERVVHDATLGLDMSLPPDEAPHAHVVSAHVGTSVAGPSPSSPFGVVDVTPDASSADELRFVQRATGKLLGRRITRRDGDEIQDVVLVVESAGVTRRDLAAWFDQHIAREVLFDDVWQVAVHLVAGLDAPASIRYLG